MEPGRIELPTSCLQIRRSGEYSLPTKAIHGIERLADPSSAAPLLKRYRLVLKESRPLARRIIECAEKVDKSAWAVFIKDPDNIRGEFQHLLSEKHRGVEDGFVPCSWCF